MQKLCLLFFIFCSLSSAIPLSLHCSLLSQKSNSLTSFSSALPWVVDVGVSWGALGAMWGGWWGGRDLGAGGSVGFWPIWSWLGFGRTICVLIWVIQSDLECLICIWFGVLLLICVWFGVLLLICVWFGVGVGFWHGCVVDGESKVLSAWVCSWLKCCRRVEKGLRHRG